MDMFYGWTVGTLSKTVCHDFDILIILYKYDYAPFLIIILDVTIRALYTCIYIHVLNCKQIYLILFKY